MSVYSHTTLVERQVARGRVGDQTLFSMSMSSRMMLDERQVVRDKMVELILNKRQSRMTPVERWAARNSVGDEACFK